MPEQPPDPLFVSLELSLLAASVVTWLFLFMRFGARGRILDYEPRRPVPWGPPAAMVAVVLVALTIPAAIIGGETVDPPVTLKPSEAAGRILGFIMFQVIVGATALAIALVTSRPDRRDLGLPSSWVELIRDVRVGVIAFLASLAPVFGTLILARYLTGQMAEPSHHALVETVLQASGGGVLLLAALSAVVFAPVCEEIVFRLLLQGWLEKTREPRSDEAPITNEPGQSTNDECRMTNVVQPPPTDSSLEIRHSSLTNAGLLRGWAPILASSLLFGIAHAGYGPEPAPLFVLALILGYVYQRTHRIVPSIVTHALFNLLTVLMLWRMVALSTE